MQSYRWCVHQERICNFFARVGHREGVAQFLPRHTVLMPTAWVSIESYFEYGATLTNTAFRSNLKAATLNHANGLWLNAAATQI